MSCRIRRCQLCQDWLNSLSAILKFVTHFHIFWTICHIFTKIGRDHQHHVLDVPQKYEDSATYCSRDITIIEKKRLTFAIFVSKLYFWRHFVPWVMLILKMSHLSFSKTASVRHIEVNGQRSFRYSSLKICPILPKIVSDDLWTELNRTC